MPRNVLSAVVFLIGFSVLSVHAQQTGAKDSPVIVQPGAPGQPTRVLPSTTRAKLPPRSPKDVEFMQGMIMHHAQAVEMTALINSRTVNEKIRRLGARISQSQSDEMKFMKRWLESRGEKTSMPMAKMEMSGKNEQKMEMPGMNMPGMNISNESAQMLMPGMLTAAQMEALRNAQGAKFDALFLSGMIQHHGGALVMVKEMFETAGAGQDAELFNFATDVDSGQRAEIKIMQNLADEKSSGEK